MWTNVFQALLFLVAGAATLAYLLAQHRRRARRGRRASPARRAASTSSTGGRARRPDFWRRVLTEPNIVWVAVLNGLVGSMAAFGTDHDLMQRLLTVETRRESQRTLALTPIGTLLTLAIYLSLGAALYTFYASTRGCRSRGPTRSCRTSSQQVMPAVLRGLMLSAIVLASIDSPLGSLAASFVTDIYRPLLAPRAVASATTCACRARRVVVFGVVLGCSPSRSRSSSQILWLAFKIAGVTFGSLLGVFLLGLLDAPPAWPTAPTWSP